MRLRISQAEAAYLVQVLEISKGELLKKDVEFETLQDEVRKLREIILLSVYDASRLKISEKKEQLKKVMWLSFQIHKHFEIHSLLLNKFKAISEGQPHDGRYKTLSLYDRFWDKTLKPLLEITEQDIEINVEINREITELYEQIKNHVPSRKVILCMERGIKIK